MRALLPFSIFAVLVHELLRCQVLTMTGEIAGKPITDELLVWLSVLVVAFVMAVGNKVRRLIKLLKLSMIGLVLYRSFTLSRDTSEAGWTVLSSKGVSPAFEQSVLMRLVAVMVQIPNAVALIPSVVDADLAWLITLVPASKAEVLTAARSNLKSALEIAVAAIPWYRITLTIMDVAGIMIFFKLIRVTVRVSIGLPKALSPGLWIKYIKTHGYSFVKDLPVVKREIAKERETRGVRNGIEHVV